MTDATTDAATEAASIDTDNRPLAGQTKQYLDDLAELRRRTTQELARGVSDGYLTIEKALELADRLGVERPRVRTNRWVYVEVTRVYSLQVPAYDDEDAKEQAAPTIDRLIREDTTDYTGTTRSRFLPARDGEQGRRLRVSEPTTVRPNLLDVQPMHPNTRAEGERVRRTREESAAS